MGKNLLIKILEMLEETYPECYRVERLVKKLNVSLNGEFTKLIKYLYARKKIDVRLHNYDGTYPQSFERLQQNDEISITPEGIDFLSMIKLQQTQYTQTKILDQQKLFTKILAMATAILALGTILQVLFYFVVNQQQITGSQRLITDIFMMVFGILIIAIVLIFKDVFKHYRK